MKKILIFIFFSCLLLPAFAQQEEESLVDEFGDTIQVKPRFYPVYRLGVFGHGMFSSSRVILTDYAGSRDSRIGYVPLSYGGVVRVDFKKWAIESGVGFTEKHVFLSTGNEQFNDKQYLSLKAKASCMEIPLLFHLPLHRPDSKTVVSPFVGFSFNAMGNWTVSDLKQQVSSLDTSLNYLGSTTATKVNPIGSFAGSFIAGVGTVRKIKKMGAIDFGVSYHVDFLSMPKVQWDYSYRYTGGADRNYSHYFRYANQSIRFRLTYYFLNFTTEKKPKPPVVPALVVPAAASPTDSIQTPSIIQAPVDSVPADSLKPERFYRIKF